MANADKNYLSNTLSRKCKIILILLVSKYLNKAGRFYIILKVLTFGENLVFLG